MQIFYLRKRLRRSRLLSLLVALHFRECKCQTDRFILMGVRFALNFCDKCPGLVLIEKVVSGRTNLCKQNQDCGTWRLETYGSWKRSDYRILESLSDLASDMMSDEDEILLRFYRKWNVHDSFALAFARLHQNNPASQAYVLLTMNSHWRCIKDCTLRCFSKRSTCEEIEIEITAAMVSAPDISKLNQRPSLHMKYVRRQRIK